MARPNPRKAQFVPNRSGKSDGKNTGNPGGSKAGKNVGSYSMEVDPVGLRIIGGKFRGSKLSYLGDRRLRPMKDRVREAAFNLIHSYVKDSFVLDLFGGTGALGLESLSRGAVGCVFTEQHFPTARIIRQNIESLNLQEQAQVFAGDVFLWYMRKPELPKDHPWLVFCSPPYFFFNERTEDLTGLLKYIWDEAPEKSVFVVESDTTFDWSAFDFFGEWDIRPYPPAVLGILQKNAGTESETETQTETN